MKRRVLLFACLFVALPALLHAQKKKKTTTPPSYSGKGLTVPGTAFLFPEPGAPEVKFDYRQPGAPLPAFSVIDKESKDISQEVTRNGANLFLIVFNPTCEHCEEETQTLRNNISSFGKSRILLVASAIMTPYLPFFEENVHVSPYPERFTVAIDSAKVLDKLFNFTDLPQINIYSGSDRRLLKTFNGFTPMDSLKAYIQ